MHDDIPTYEMRRVGRVSIRGRIVLVFGLAALFCVVMAYVTGKPDVIGACSWGLGGTGCQYADHSSPNLVWFFLGFWPGAVAAITAFGSWVFTGRPW